MDALQLLYNTVKNDTSACVTVVSACKSVLSLGVLCIYYCVVVPCVVNCEKAAAPC